MAFTTPAWDDDLDGSLRPTIEVGREGGRAVVRLCGEHDVSTADDVRYAVSAARWLGTGHVVVDLSGTTFLDGAVVRALARSWRGAGLPSDALTIRGPSAPVRRYLTLCGVAHLIEAAAPELRSHPPRDPPGRIRHRWRGGTG